MGIEENTEAVAVTTNANQHQIKLREPFSGVLDICGTNRCKIVTYRLGAILTGWPWVYLVVVYWSSLPVFVYCEEHRIKGARLESRLVRGT